VSGGATRVLDALRRAHGRSCSGESLSTQYGVSRTQVWKHVKALRARGYSIDAAPGGGYRLAGIPDRLYPEEILSGLDTRWLAREIRFFESTDSTNRIAVDLARGGAAHGTAVVAEAQTAGRGRLGRSFFSPPHLNLYTSIVLRPRLTTAAAPCWILASAAAVADTVAETVADPEAVEIKWPNDVLLGGRKTSGILMELGAEATWVTFLVLGIGVNLNVDREAFPVDFRDLATSLASHDGRCVDRVAFARRLYGNLERTLSACERGGFEAVRPQFEGRFRMAGRRVTVVQMPRSEPSVGGDRRASESGPGATEPARDELTGVVVGIDAGGSLRLACDDGEEIRVLAGDVTMAKEGA
jgi:BirA family biotin operon repressor/biotin-[acetyl-CoA-carboxylase] ligase